MCAEQKNVIQKMIYQNHDPTDDSQDDVLEKEENGASNSSRHEQNRHGHLKNNFLCYWGREKAICLGNEFHLGYSFYDIALFHLSLFRRGVPLPGRGNIG